VSVDHKNSKRVAGARIFIYHVKVRNPPQNSKPDPHPPHPGDLVPKDSAL